MQEYEAKYKDYPHWEADRAYFAMQVYQAGVEAAHKAKNAWPGQEDIINAMEGMKVESLGGPGHMRKDHIAEQTFYQGMTTHKNRSTSRPSATVDEDVLRPAAEAAGADFWKWIETANNSDPDQCFVTSAFRDDVLTAFFDILIGGVFHASVLFLVAAGLQLVFGVQKIVNLACGSFYALGAYFGISAVELGDRRRRCRRALPAGAARRGRPRSALIGPAIERAAAHRLRPRRGVPAPAHLRARAHVPGRAALLLGRQPAAARQPRR